MEIDLNQLPIPDWGLHCPRCHYALRGLPSHRCPECGLAFDISTLIGPWTRLRPPRFTGDELPLPNFGLLCAACGDELAGAATHVCPHCGETFDPQALRPAGEWFAVDARLCGALSIMGVQALLAAETVPHVPAQGQALAGIVGGSAPGFALRVLSEFYFEVLWILQGARREARKARASRATGRWSCVQCGQKNPANFDICWNCEAARPDSAPEP
jgi:membrane protease subunit (stomatin/prohibitin family)